MREQFRFKLLMHIDEAAIAAALADVSKLKNWAVSATKSLGDPRRRSAMMRWTKHYPSTGIGPTEMIGSFLDTSNRALVPNIMYIVYTVCAAFGWTELGFCTISDTGPGGTIKPHIDGGEYFNAYHRIQIPLSAGPGILFMCETETVEMKPGEVWCFDNKRVHWIENRSEDSRRVSLLFDARVKETR